MTTDDLLTRLKTLSFWQVGKSLPFDAGGSSTRVVYMMTGFAVLVALEIVSTAFAWVYVRDPQHSANLVVAGTIGSLATASFGFAANSQNLRHTLRSQEGTGVSTIADTPLTSESVQTEPEPETIPPQENKTSTP